MIKVLIEDIKVIIILLVIIVFIGNLNKINNIGIIMKVLFVFIIFEIILMKRLMIINKYLLNEDFLELGFILININVNVSKVIMIYIVFINVVLNKFVRNVFNIFFIIMLLFI